MQNEIIKGRGAQFNPANKYLGLHHYPDRSLPETYTKIITRYFSEKPASILSKNNSPDIPYTYSINPYQGCEHGCVYCYARNTHTYWGFSAGLDWESKIVVKEKAAYLLEKEFLKGSWKPQTIVMSGNTDPYQPAERKYEVTRDLLKVFLKYKNPVSIITKNALVRRDIDMLKALATDNLSRVIFSITTIRESLRRKLEPRSSNAVKLFEAIKALSSAGIPVGVMTGPVIPSLNDNEMDEILRRASESGAVSAGYTLARFNGDIEQIFSDWLHKHYKERADKIWNKVRSIHGGKVSDSRWHTRMKGEGEYAAIFHDLFDSLRNKYFKQNDMPPLCTTKFRRKGNFNLFE